MKSERIRYFVEGECEKKLVDDLKRASLLPAGKVTVFNVLTKAFSRSRLMDLVPGSVVVFVFDTDGEQDASFLKTNLKLLNTHVPNVKVFNLISVRNLEDEFIRSTKIKKIEELTNSLSASDFKPSFLKLKNTLSVLQKYEFDFNKMWCTKPEGAFSTFDQGASELKKLVNRKCG